jgi:hypothetical protein
MAKSLTLRPSRIPQFGDSSGCTFCLVTTPTIVDEITVERDGDYVGWNTYVLQPGERFEDTVLPQLPPRSHVFALCPETFFQSPDPAILGGDRKLLAMACNSTPTNSEILNHFLQIVEATSVEAQGEFSDRFFDLAERADYLEYADLRHGTSAVLNHLDPTLVWNQQAGPVEWGEQQIVPAGEISVLPIDIRQFHESLSLPLNGEITLAGYPILHNGTPSFTRSDQARIHAQLAPMSEHPVIAVVEEGRITGVHPYDDGSAGVVEMLEAMFAVDSRYRHVWEIGHGINTSLSLLTGNHAMNEVFGGSNGCLHFGLGLTPYTQFHLDIILPHTVVRSSTGELLLGSVETAPVRRESHKRRS